MPAIDHDNLARHFRALSHPRRSRIFTLLIDYPEAGDSFRSLQQHTGLCDSSLWHHLREMERCGILRKQRRGSYMTFSLRIPTFAAAIERALNLCEQARAPVRRAA